MKKFVFAIFIIFSVCAFTNCSQPIGTLEGGSVTEGLWIQPLRYEYQIEEKYNRFDDFKVFTALGGEIVEIAPTDSNISVSIMAHKNRPNSLKVSGANYQFTHDGTHSVTVEYRGRSGSYSVEVTEDGLVIVGGSGGNIGIIWK